MSRAAVEAELARLALEGRLTAENIVDVARSPTSVLHSEFEWDDSQAGERYRLIQAGRLVRSVKVVVQTERRVISTVAYVRDPAGSAGYRPLSTVVPKSLDAKAVLLDELKRVMGLLRRSRAIAEALGLEAELEGAEREVSRLASGVAGEAGQDSP